MSASNEQSTLQNKDVSVKVNPEELIKNCNRKVTWIGCSFYPIKKKKKIMMCRS